jgi:hypothetical protein
MSIYRLNQYKNQDNLDLSMNDIQNTSINEYPIRLYDIIFVIENPIKRYHSNHWFHIGEYIISKFSETINELCNNSNNNYTLDSLYSNCSSSRNIAIIGITIYIITIYKNYI